MMSILKQEHEELALLRRQVVTVSEHAANLEHENTELENKMGLYRSYALFFFILFLAENAYFFWIKP